MVGVNEIKVRCPNSLSHLAVALTVEYTKGQIPVYIEFGSNNLSVEITPKPAGNFQLSTVLCICRFLARICSSINLYGQTVLEKTEVDHWLEFSNRKYSVSEFKEKLQNLNQALSSITYLVGHELSLADICVWCMLYENKQWQTILADRKAHVNVARWYQHLLTLDNFSIVTKLFPEMAESNTRSKTEDVGKFVDLPGAEMGNVVVRFPPEASGFLHIGHAKAALLNAYYQNMFNGKLIMRFDDTNPEKEKEDFEKVILEDVAMLHIKPDIFTYTSDHFEFILQKCEELIKNELAYVDDTDAETMKLEREKKTESKNRANGIQKNLSMWAEMRKGSDYGKQCCVRAKIDMQSDNGCLRDPTLYRCKAMAHPRTGNKFNVYPTYDFACPIVDSIEGVTHALRTTEYHDRDDQYFWVLDKLKLRKLHIYEYSRLNMTHTVLSKRKLTWFVQQGIVNGWDDPRMPTVRGVLRCGMTVEGLKQFIVAQGSSRSIVVMEWDKIWSFNKKIIDPIAPRFNAVETDDKVQVLVQNAEIHTLEVARHPKNNDLGNKTITVGPKLFVDYADAEAMRVGENVTFINWGNLMVKEIVKNSDNRIDLIKTELNLENKDYKKTLKVTWVCDNENTPLIPCACIYYDHLVSKPILGKDDDFKDFLNDNTKIAVMMMGDPDLASLKKGDIIQIQRKGFFICDEPYDPSSLRYISRAGPIVLISIPDGSKDISMLPKQVKSLRTTKESSKEALNRKKGKLAEKSPQEETKQFSPTIPTSPLISSPGFTDGENALTEQIKEQGERIRIMKSENCSKDQLKPEINTLLKLKSDYKNMMGKDWKPITETQTPKKEANTKNANHVSSKKSDNVNVQNTAEVDALNDKIKEQGDRIRIMKSQSCNKDQLKPEINALLKLKSDYKNMMGKDWKPITETQTPKKEANTKNANNVPSKKSDNANVQNTAEVDVLNDKIKEQGDKIRLLKSQNCSKDQLKSEIDSLLKLKAEYKKLVGKEWKPDTEVKKSDVKTDSAAEEDKIAALSDNANVQNTAEVDALNDKIKEQGDKIRILKSQNCSKDQLKSEIDSLLKLKAEYKKLVGKEWKPDTEVKKSDVKTDSAAEEDRIAALSDNANVQNTAEVDALNDKIKEQGDKIRILKSQNCSKDQLKSEIDSLLKLKAEYKKLVGKEWKPDTEVKKSDVKTDSAADEDRITALSDNANVQNTAEVDANDKIKEQGDKIRILKSQNCSKDQLKSEIDSLLQLKAEYKKLVGKEWKPDTEVKKSNAKTDSAADEDKIAALDQQIKVQGDEIRKLKAEKASKDTLAPCINTLLKLKVEYSKLVGKEWKPTAEEPKTDAKKKEAKITESKAQNSNSVPKDKKGKTNSIPKPAEVKEEESDSSLKKITRLGLEARKEENLADWYSQTITKAEMIEYYDVSGCYILRPWAFGIWESIVNFFDPAIKALGVSNSYFPMFVSPQALEKEKSHIADFAPEVAWVTRSGNTDLAEPIAIRPTSETVMYPSYAKWIRSHRDLPLKLNQWCSVVRWEFKHPQPFLRTREFLWQEGHTAFATQPEAVEEVYKILELYAQVYESLLAIPVVRGQKTEKEKFAGADFTTTVEAFVAANGRAIQGATSHHLGQNFSKMFEIVFDDPETNEKCFAYQNSWGLTTRTIGVMVMIHGDNMGLVLPPRVAVHQIVIVPCGITATLSDADKASLLTKCSEFESNLRDAGVRVKGDYRDNYSPGWKYNHWELKGVPIRIELGPRDIKKNQFVAVRRDTGAKSVLDLSNGVGLVKQLLDEIHNSMYAKAKRELDENMVVAVEWNDFCTKLDGKCIIQAPFCGEISCEDKIKKDSARNADDLLEPGAPSMGAKGLCIPFQQPREITSDLKCINPTCMKKPKYFTLFGRSY